MVVVWCLSVIGAASVCTDSRVVSVCGYVGVFLRWCLSVVVVVSFCGCVRLWLWWYLSVVVSVCACGCVCLCLGWYLSVVVSVCGCGCVVSVWRQDCDNPTEEIN